MTAAAPRSARLAAPVVVIGPMGAGKSSVGKRVAKALDVPFTDTDRVIVREHGPIPAIFSSRGEPVFRELEAVAVRAAVATHGVVAVGGGAVTHAATRAALAGARIVLLTVSPEAVAERIAGTDRPLLASGGIDAWQTITDERAATYAELAHIVVDTSRRPMSRVVDEVVAWVREQERRADRDGEARDQRASDRTARDEPARDRTARDEPGRDRTARDEPARDHTERDHTARHQTDTTGGTA